MYKIFDQTPGRRTDYKNVGNAIDKDFSMQLVSHRWIKNEQVAKKATAMWPKVNTVIHYWKELPKSKQPGSGTRGANDSYDRFCASLNGSLIPLKLLLIHKLQRN